MKKKLLITGLSILVFLLLFYGTYTLATSRTFQLFGGMTAQVETNKKVVALTFDDGPTENITQILPLLDKYNVKATFFLIGQDIENYPEGAKQIAAAGHQIGNHTYSHHRMVFKTPSFIQKELEKTDTLILEAGYEGEIDFRPPYGKKLIGLPYYLKKQNKETITWNLEPDTFYSAASDKVKYVKENVTPGSIILLHPMYEDAEQALETIEGVIQTLLEKGYTFVTVDELQEL
ncbi:polysaccharide deacetylase family protein [Niallia endozanthoxylica]|uniref:Polysaccharide deacetylase family protein n=1 Tax=Niallia endozanthoxylica TaxID=2036016 RepID=A0A5J5I081_9BACI|nr:polysaccharide deacetylase family protein [Niallia endozanthoxylica]KAA9027836.1 polysaccharide deacetylase family protein [Niallia endozanthoxylica]